MGSLGLMLLVLIQVVAKAMPVNLTGDKARFWDTSRSGSEHVRIIRIFRSNLALAAPYLPSRETLLPKNGMVLPTYR